MSNLQKAKISKETAIRNRRIHYEQICRTDRRFFGERRFVPYFVELIEGANLENPPWAYAKENHWRFDIKPEDVEVFDELARTAYITIDYDPDYDLYVVESYGK